jgi:hypothetical protein
MRPTLTIDQALLRFIPGIVFLLNTYALWVFSQVIGNSASAIIFGLNSVLIGLATIKWTKRYESKMLQWEPRAFRIAGALAIVFGILSVTAGIAEIFIK